MQKLVPRGEIHPSGVVGLVISGVKPMAFASVSSALDSSLQTQRTEDVPLLGANKAVAGPNPRASTNWTTGLQSACCTDRGPVQATGKFPVGEQTSRNFSEP